MAGCGGWFRGPMGVSGHEHTACGDDDCPRFICRVYKEGYCDGYGDGYSAGSAEGYADGYGDGHADGAAGAAG